MEIRTATFVDVPALVAIANSSAHAAHWSAGQHLKSITAADAVYLIAADDHGPVGFIVGNIVGEDCELENIAVMASRTRQGIASALFREFVQQVQTRGAKRLLLEVRESNAAARAFYAGRGFKESGRRKNYYANPEEDAVLHELIL